MKQQKTIYVFTGMVENENGEILMTKRSESKLPEAHDKWELPGGKADFGETPEQAIVREVFEETGYTVDAEKILPVTVTTIWEYPECSQHTIVFCFRCRLKNNECIEVTDYKVSEIGWIKPENIKDLLLLEGTETFVDAYLEEKVKI